MSSRLNKNCYNIAVDHLADFYGVARKTVDSTGVETEHAAIVCSDTFKQQSSWFYDYMTGICMHIKDTQTLWVNIDNDISVSSRISEIQKLAHVLLSLPASSVEPERSFSQMALLKDCKRNRLLPKHLNTCMRLAKSRFTLSSFPLKDAHRVWLSSDRYMV